MAGDTVIAHVRLNMAGLASLHGYVDGTGWRFCAGSDIPMTRRTFDISHRHVSAMRKIHILRNPEEPVPAYFLARFDIFEEGFFSRAFPEKFAMARRTRLEFRSS
jgi:hypothetical protein